MKFNPPIITIDGPAGTGKTTVAKKVAEKLNLPYFDTGAMYRSVAFLMLKEKIPLSDTEKIEKLLHHFNFEIREGGRYFASGIDVTDEIRSQAVTNMVSPVAALAPVRQALWEIQRRFAKKQGGVFEGRDMGSVVFPKAPYKIFLTAKPQVRAERRLAELKEKRSLEAQAKTHEQMLQEIMQRDEYDSNRSLAPLACPPDAFVIDSSDLTIDHVVEKIVEYKNQKRTLPSWTQLRISFLYRTVLFLSWCIGKFFFRLKVYGLEHYYPGGAIIAANHTSFLDPPIVSVSWPEEVHFLARDTLFKNRFFGALIRNVNAHPVGRDSADISAIKTVCSLLEAGKKVVLFPEGTRSKNGELQPLKPGMGMFIVRTKTAVIPAYIHGAFQVWGRHQKWPRLFRQVACVFGSPITAAAFSHLDKKEAQAKISEQLSQAILGLKKWYENGAQGIPP